MIQLESHITLSDIRRTWNSAPTEFSAIKLDVTDTASAATSKLIDLRVGNVEKFAVTKAGAGRFAGQLFSPGASIGAVYAATAAPSNGMIVQGNVGIGTASPAGELHVYDSGGTTADILLGQVTSGATSADGARIRSTGSDASLFNLENGFLSFGTGGAERIRITNTGNVGIGTTGPSARLHAISITEQQRIAYDASNYWSTVVGSAGGVTFDSIGSNAGFTFSKRIIAGAQVRLKTYTVATLPAGTVGDTAFVTDALAPTYGAAAVGGGAVIVPVFYNGTNWITA